MEENENLVKGFDTDAGFLKYDFEALGNKPNIDEIENEISEMKNTIEELQLFKYPNVTIIGTPTINHGQVTNFSATSYLKFPFLVDFRSQSFDIDMAFTTGSNVTSQENIFDSDFGLAFAIRNGKFVIAISTNGTNWDLGEGVGSHTVQPNTNYFVRISWNKTQYELSYSLDGTNYTSDIVKAGTAQPYPRQIYIGVGENFASIMNHFTGIINLNGASVKVNGEVIWTGMDDAGLATRADVSLSNIDADGEQKIKEIAETDEIKTKLIAKANDNEVVKITPQTLTDAQKAQARQNLGLGESGTVDEVARAEIAEVKSDLNELGESRHITKSIIWQQTNQFYNNLGNVTTVTSYYFQSFITTTRDTSYSIKCTSDYTKCAYVVLNSDNEIIDKFFKLGENAQYTVDVVVPNGFTLILQAKANDRSLYELVEEEPFSLKDKVVHIRNLDDDATALLPKDVPVKNLFNINDEEILLNKYIDRENYIDSSRFNVSGYIPVELGKTYTFPAYPDYFGTATASRVFCYTNAKVYYTFLTGTLNGKLLTVTVNNANIKYIRFNFANGSIRTDIKSMYQVVDNLMFMEAPYSMHRYYPYGIENEMLDSVRVSHENTYNSLFGKSIIFTGDSICHGSSANDNLSGWSGRIGNRNNMIWKNAGISGATFTDNVGSSGCIANTDFEDGADYIIIEGGTNDADIVGSILEGNVPTKFGSYSMNDYNLDFDKNTFCGAVESLFKRITTDYKGAKIGYIVAQKMGRLNSSTPDYTSEHNNRRAYFEVIIKLCEKWGIPYLNLWDSCYLNPVNPMHYTQGQDYLYTDGQHLTSNGYEVVTGVIESWLKTL